MVAALVAVDLRRAAHLADAHHQRVLEEAQRAILQAAIEIDQNIAARYEMRFEKHFVGGQAVVREHDAFFQRAGKARAAVRGVIVVGERAFATRGQIVARESRDALERVNARFGARERIGIDVGRVEQRAPGQARFVEQDLQVTKDVVLICLHDPDLARTTNVAEVVRDRARERDVEGTGKSKRGWYTIDFTLAEVKQLDAGSWFNRENSFAANPAYIGLRVPTMKEVIDFVGDRAGLYIELKHYPFYKSQGIDIAGKLAALLEEGGFNRPPRTDRVFIQSFSKESLLLFKKIAPNYRRVQLLPMEDHGREKDSAIMSQALAKEIAGYAAGAGPNKSLLKNAGDVETLHAAGLLIHPYTFRGSTTAVKRRPLDEAGSGGTLRNQISGEIRRYLDMGIDGGFTDYPAVWRQAVE